MGRQSQSLVNRHDEGINQRFLPHQWRRGV
nr:MAG TPA: hypothetical protein [Caudoviricetes sp.]